MPFYHPVIFWSGLAAVAVPILIHLLNRRRFRVQEWAAMQFLLESVRRNRRRLRIEELILLAIRSLVVLLIGLTLARFSGCSTVDKLGLGKETSQTIVFVLDDSCSMGQKLGADTLFSQAVAHLSRQIETLGPDNKAAILLTSNPDPSDPFCRLNYITEKTSLLTRLAQLKSSDTRANLGDALGAAQAMLAGQTGSRRIVMLSDWRKADLVPQELSMGVRKRYAQLRKDGVELTFVDYGRDAKKNLTIESIQLMDKIAVVGAPARIALSVHNNGSATAGDVEIQISGQVQVAGKPLQTIKLPSVMLDTLRPGESKHLEFSVTCPEAGAACIEARLPSSDELRGDDVADLALNVRPAMRLLVVDGAPNVNDESQSESYFLTRAVDPNRNGSYGIKADVVSDDALGEVKFADYDLVVLMNVVSLPPASDPNRPDVVIYPQLTQLEQYVRDGGGLVVFTGDRINISSFYNGPFYNNGQGLSPFPIASLVDSGKVGTAYEKVKFFRLAPQSMAADRMLEIFRGEASDFTNLIRFYTFHRVNEAAGASLAGSAPGQAAHPPRVLARFTDDQSSPAIVTRQYGAGNVLFFYTSRSVSRPLSREWNDWPKAELDTYVVVMLDMLQGYARQQPSLSDRVAAPIIWNLPSDLQDAKAILKTPLYPAKEEILLKPQNGQVRYDLTSQAGLYTLELTPPGGATQQMLLSRFVDGAEGDLRAGGQAAIEAAAGAKDFTYVRSQEGLVDAMQGGHDKEYWMWFAAALLGLLALEVFLGQRFGHYA